MNNIPPISKYTPDYTYCCTVMGYHIFQNGNSYSVDDKLNEDQLESIIDYMIQEGFIDENSDWYFLT